ncbi:putative structural protein [Erwinia phage pEa_SNUABM_47]|uniref:Putative structural protein n=2 Tax=Eneladusvirus BF TaxID=2560751 RepID=A0A7L8ZPH1_9CAUD|nr:putative structural protein [Erwinia phage pEa_SNUABM_12]QOI71960.1 putative structural protein [Erwinia phage pEa_SNUABM_47]QXO11631.1 hypothetical protein pEaSNUABM19_00520 [Erwinia phage pEa_SNUABM_19]QXO12179.1 hypothetical protein pEaSNUABM44_00518 [Erwinia phage pEa_SNUABM_44]
MQVQFQTVLFDSEDYRFAVVVEETLVIVTSKGEIELEFDSEAEALAGQLELGEVLDAAKGSNIASVIQDAAETVSGLVSGLFGKTGFGSVKSKVAGKAAKATAGIDERVNEFLRQLDEAIKGAEQAVPARADTRRASTAEAEDVFGTSRTRRAVDADAVVSTLSDADLQAVISTKADQLIATNRQVQGLVANLRRFHSEEEVQEAIDAHKEMVFNVARANDELTVNEVFNHLLR